MGKEQTYKIGREKLTKDQIPQSFDILNVFSDFREKARKVGVEQALEELAPLIRQQLRALIMETVGLPNTDEYLYSVHIDEKGEITVHDENYPLQTNMVERSIEGWIFALGHKTKPERRAQSSYTALFFQLYKQGIRDPRTVQNLEQQLLNAFASDLLPNQSPRLGQIFIDRYLLEAWQNFLLVHVELAKNPLFAKPIIDQLASSQTNKNSEWLMTAMNKTGAHPGDRAFINFYRARNNNGNPVVEKRGWYNKLDNARLVKLFKKLGIENVEPTEASLMTTFGHLDESWNMESMDLIMKIAQFAGDRKIKREVAKAQKRFENQEEHIQEAVRVFLEVFKDEFPRTDSQQAERLRALLEIPGNTLILERAFKGKETLEKYRTVLLAGKGRDAFVRSLVKDMPTLAFPVGGFIVKALWGISGWSICGSLSVGGLGVKGLGTSAQLNGFGGLPSMSKDSCMICPKCGLPSRNPKYCTTPNCFNVRPGFGPHPGLKHSTNLSANKKNRVSLHDSKTKASKGSGIKIFGGFNTTINQVTQLGPKKIIKAETIFQPKSHAHVA